MSHRLSEVAFILSHPLYTTHGRKNWEMRENQDPGSLRERLDWEEKGIPIHLHIFLTSLPCALLLALTLFHFISTFHLYRHHFEMIPSIFMYRKKELSLRKTP